MSMIAPYLASPLVDVFKPEHESLFRLIKNLNSTKMNDFLINGGDFLIYQLLYIVMCLL